MLAMIIVLLLVTGMLLDAAFDLPDLPADAGAGRDQAYSWDLIWFAFILTLMIWLSDSSRRRWR